MLLFISLVFLSGANIFRLVSVGSSIFVLSLSTKLPNFLIRYGLAPGIALA